MDVAYLQIGIIVRLDVGIVKISCSQYFSIVLTIPENDTVNEFMN